MDKLANIVSQFDIVGNVVSVQPLGNGLINDTYKVVTTANDAPSYVLQRINHLIFTDVDLLQNNIEAVTNHIRGKLKSEGVKDVDRRVLTFVKLKNSDRTYYFDGENYWRLSVFIQDAVTFEAVTADSARQAGEAFGNFQSMLADLEKPLGETIPGFHSMVLRLNQLDEAVKQDKVGRVAEVKDLLDFVNERHDRMTFAERLNNDGKLQKRLCHCDTKVNNMMFDKSTGDFLLVIDLDTVMPSFVFSDYGDFLRTAASTAAEDDPDLSKVEFNNDIFRAFTEGYLKGADFLTDVEIDHLPEGVMLFPYMQGVRFLTDYINGDTYYKIKYPEHNLVRTRNQFKLLTSIEANLPQIRSIVSSLKH